MRFAVLPQVLSNFASYGLLRFEINVRGAGVMGFVGAGGIGQEFLVAIRNFYYTDVSAILLLVILTVMAIDLATERLRHHLLGLERAVSPPDPPSERAGPRRLCEQRYPDAFRVAVAGTAHGGLAVGGLVGACWLRHGAARVLR